MLLGVISDTHDNLQTIKTALQYFRDQQVDLVVHCGDWKKIETMHYFAELAATLHLKTYAVLGNRDEDVDTFLAYASHAPGEFELHESTFEICADSTKVVAVHGHHKPTFKKVLEDSEVKIILRGHSHKPLIENQTGKLIVNPGSTAFSIPRSKTWRPSVGIVDTKKMEAELIFF